VLDIYAQLGAKSRLLPNLFLELGPIEPENNVAAAETIKIILLPVKRSGRWRALLPEGTVLRKRQSQAQRELQSLQATTRTAGQRAGDRGQQPSPRPHTLEPRLCSRSMRPDWCSLVRSLLEAVFSVGGLVQHSSFRAGSYYPP
jgi:hypothetical protein